MEVVLVILWFSQCRGVVGIEGGGGGGTESPASWNISSTSGIMCTLWVNLSNKLSIILNKCNLIFWMTIIMQWHYQRRFWRYVWLFAIRPASLKSCTPHHTPVSGPVSSSYIIVTWVSIDVSLTIYSFITELLMVHNMAHSSHGVCDARWVTCLRLQQLADRSFSVNFCCLLSHNCFYFRDRVNV